MHPLRMSCRHMDVPTAACMNLWGCLSGADPLHPLAWRIDRTLYLPWASGYSNNVLLCDLSWFSTTQPTTILCPNPDVTHRVWRAGS